MIGLDRVLRRKPNVLRAWGLCFAVVSLACPQALACSPSGERSIIYEHVPTDLDAPVIVEVTIEERGFDVIDPSNDVQMAVMRARVHRVVKGPIGEGALKIVTELGGRGFGVGSTGIVAGTLRHDAQGGLELVAIQKSNMRAWSVEFWRRQLNAGSAAGADK
jgi:hypothetical protein